MHRHSREQHGLLFEKDVIQALVVTHFREEFRQLLVVSPKVLRQQFEAAPLVEGSQKLEGHVS